MTPERLRGLCWRDYLELRRAGFPNRQTTKSVRTLKTNFQKKMIGLLEHIQAVQFQQSPEINKNNIPVGCAHTRLIQGAPLNAP
jgi:hypothetical protein